MGWDCSELARLPPLLALLFLVLLASICSDYFPKSCSDENDFISLFFPQPINKRAFIYCYKQYGCGAQEAKAYFLASSQASLPNI